MDVNDGGYEYVFQVSIRMVPNVHLDRHTEPVVNEDTAKGTLELVGMTLVQEEQADVGIWLARVNQKQHAMIVFGEHLHLIACVGEQEYHIEIEMP